MLMIKFDVLLLCLVFLLFQPGTGNVLFRFSIGFGVDGDDDSTESFNKTIIIDDNGITVKDNTDKVSLETSEVKEHISTVTEGLKKLETQVPVEDSEKDRYNVSDANLERYNVLATEQLPVIREAMLNFKNEIVPLADRNDGIAAKVKLITRYLKELNEVLTLSNTKRLAKMQALDGFLNKMEKLEHINSSSNDIEKLLMELLLSKHGLTELRSKIRDELNFIQNTIQNVRWQKLIFESSGVFFPKEHNNSSVFQILTYEENLKIRTYQQDNKN